jgi:hypothetical protein
MILNPKDMHIEEIATRNRAISLLKAFLLFCPTETAPPSIPFDQAAQKPLYSRTNSSSMIIEAPLNPVNPANSSTKYLLKPMSIFLRERLLHRLLRTYAF